MNDDNNIGSIITPITYSPLRHLFLSRYGFNLIDNNIINNHRGVNHIRIVRMLGLYIDPEGEHYIITEYLAKGNI